MADEVEVLEFDLGSERYCVDITQVEEVVETDRDELTSVPNAPAHVEGVMDLRGQTTTIVDPRGLYDLESNGNGHAGDARAEQVIVFDGDAIEYDGAMGWSVDEVYQVAEISPDDVDEAANDDDSIEGIVNTEDGFLIWTSPDVVSG